MKVHLIAIDMAKLSGHQELKYCGSSQSEASLCGIAELFTCRERSRVNEEQQARLTERQAEGKNESR